MLESQRKCISCLLCSYHPIVWTKVSASLIMVTMMCGGMAATIYGLFILYCIIAYILTYAFTNFEKP